MQTFPTSSSQGFSIQDLPVNTSNIIVGTPSTSTLHQGNDPNSAQIFKHSIQLTLESVLSLQGVARSALAGMQNAYHPGSSPAQTEADIATVKQDFIILSDMMRHSGVGALPLLPPDPSSPQPQPSQTQAQAQVPSETQLMEDAARSIQVLYERLRRVQESAGMVANLLGAAS